LMNYGVIIKENVENLKRIIYFNFYHK
jgi:hypothetical protein